MANFALTKRITPADIGINSKDGDSATFESSWIDARGYNQATLFIKFVASGSASTVAITFNIEVSDDAGTTSYFVQTEAISAGVATLSKLQYSSDTKNANHNFVVDFPCNYPHFRITDMDIASGHSTDKITVSAILGKV